MKARKISKERAIVIAARHNCVPVEVAEKYTLSELREVLRHLRLMAKF